MFKLLSVLFVAASTVVAIPAAREAATQAFLDPTIHGGSWLDNAGSGGGEPLNVFIPSLVDSDTSSTQSHRLSSLA